MKRIAELGHVIPVRDVPMWAHAHRNPASDASERARQLAMGFFPTKAIWIAEQTVDEVLHVVAWDQFHAVEIKVEA